MDEKDFRAQAREIALTLIIITENAITKGSAIGSSRRWPHAITSRG